MGPPTSLRTNEEVNGRANGGVNGGWFHGHDGLLRGCAVARDMSGAFIMGIWYISSGRLARCEAAGVSPRYVRVEILT